MHRAAHAHTQTHTGLAAVCTKATILWHNVGPIPVTGVDGQTQIHTLGRTHTHTVTYTLLHGYVHAPVPSNKAERGQWGLMLLQLEHLIQCLTKFPFPWPSHAHLSASNKPVSRFSFTFSNSIYVLFHQYFPGSLPYTPLLFWVVCVFEPGSDEEWRHLGFTGQRKQLMAATTENELKTL